MTRRSYTIDLSDNEAEYLMMLYNVRTDLELQKMLQYIVKKGLPNPLTIKQLDDMRAMKASSKIRS